MKEQPLGFVAEKRANNSYDIAHYTMERVAGRYMRLRECIKSGLSRSEARRFLQDNPNRTLGWSKAQSGT